VAVWIAYPLSKRRVPGNATVYNFEVAGTHTYFVGGQVLCVHNTEKPCPDPDPDEGAPSTGKGADGDTPESMGDDFDKALDEIDNGKPRPNVRNSKPFKNDGRGGTSPLPSKDASGNPIDYTEHTVNPREPMKKLDGSRIITGSDGSVWGTADHFVTWTKIR
jgi:hypothetical protein